MPTFQELSQQMAVTKQQKLILEHLIEYIDENFRRTAGEPAKKALLGEDKQPVPESAFETIISAILLPELEGMTAEVNRILGSPVASSSEPGQGVPAPESRTTGEPS